MSITISLCMIVKDEEAVLERCLRCLKDIVEEIIIVDTGSVDRTKEIAKNYTDLIYEFQWIDNFAAARNFSFSKATKEYIYIADADEIVDEENQQKLLYLKEVLLPEVEIVQMKYCNQLQYNTTYNFDVEYRPKLLKRLRQFHWVDAIHESIRLEPIIYNSEIEIIHKPLQNHGKRDFNLYQKIIAKGEILSKKVVQMYARELYIAGTEQDFLTAKPFFEEMIQLETRSIEEIKDAYCIVARACLIQQDINNFFKQALKYVAAEPNAEICYELGQYYYSVQNYEEAIIWYYNAGFETVSTLNIHYAGDLPRKRLSECYRHLNNIEEATAYQQLAEQWQVPKSEEDKNRKK